MKARFPHSCVAVAREVAADKLTEDELLSAFEAVAQERTRLKNAGQTDLMQDRLREFAERHAEKTKVAAALQKRHEALNIIARERLMETVTALRDQGLKPHQALLAVLEGTQRGVVGGRNSVEARKWAYQGRYVGDMLAQMQRERPHLEAMLHDPAFDKLIMREMAELREGGKPGATRNADAQYAAKIFATYAEMSRVELNELGASIGKLDGWTGAQTHDDLKLIGEGKQAWVDAVEPLLDIARTFPDASSRAEVRDILEDVFDTIVTGVSSKPTTRPDAGRVNPANLAKSLGKSRVLHFRDVDSAIAYRERFGYGNTASSIINHQRKAGELAAMMDMLGPNPENMFGSLVDRLARDIRDDPKLSPGEKAKQSAKLKFDAGALRHAFDIASGLNSRPVNMTGAKIAADARAVQSMAKLGGATLSSMPADTITVALASQFRGGGFFHGLTDTIGGILKGRPKGEAKEIAYLLGEGFDAIIGKINEGAVARDMPVGKLAKLQERFFKWNGMTWWDSTMRGVAARGVAAEMGMRAGTAFDALPANYRHVLGLHGIGAKEWQALRKAGTRVADGRQYITPDLVRNLLDRDVHELASRRLSAIDQELAQRQAKRTEQTAKEAEWARNRAFKLAGLMGRMEARLEARIASMKGEKDADITHLREVAAELRGALDETKGRLDEDMDHRAIGRQEGALKAKLATVNAKIAGVERQFQKVGKDKAADLLADWVSRKGDLKEFTDRMQRYADARSVAGNADEAAHAGRIKAVYDRARRDLELQMRAFVADETKYGMLSTDARSRRTSTLGTRPGTFAGEAVRFIMQFKGFPVAFTQRVLGRAVYGARKDASMFERGAHIGTMLAGLAGAGYAAMVMKDTAKGYWPPRDPSDPKVILAALQQGGALGIYGDYLFGEASRFGNSALETAAGPTLGTASSLINTALKTRDYMRGKLSGEDASSPLANWISLMQGNTPFANLFYTKPAVDYLFVNGVREWASPGYNRRQQRQRMKDYGQKNVFTGL